MVDGAIVELDTGRTAIGQITPERFYQEALDYSETDKKSIEKNREYRHSTQKFNFYRTRAFSATRSFCRLKGYRMPSSRWLDRLDAVEPSQVVKNELKRQRIAYLKKRKR